MKIEQILFTKIKNGYIAKSSENSNGFKVIGLGYTEEEAAKHFFLQNEKVSDLMMILRNFKKKEIKNEN